MRVAIGDGNIEGVKAADRKNGIRNRCGRQRVPFRYLLVSRRGARLQR
jgi:hypothetical protein